MFTILTSILLYWETFIALEVRFYHELYNRNGGVGGFEAVIWSETLVHPPAAQWLLTGHIKCLLIGSKSFTLRQTQSRRWGFVFSPYNRRLGSNLTSDIRNINTNKASNIKLYQSRTLV